MSSLKKLSIAWKEKGFKDSKIAEMIGITPQSLSRKLNGKQVEDITINQAVIICQAINQPIEKFIGSEE